MSNGIDASIWIVDMRAAILDKDTSRMKFLLDNMPTQIEKKSELEELSNLLQDGITHVTALKEDVKLAMDTLDKNRRYTMGQTSSIDIKS